VTPGGGFLTITSLCCIETSISPERAKTRPGGGQEVPRTSRIVVEGFPHHVVHRGNNRQRIFGDVEDREDYLSLARVYSLKHACEVLAYCLMNNHVHLLLIPGRQTSLAKMMQGVSLCFTQRTNRKYGRTGRLWECRFYSCPIDKDRYLLNALHYIESNPVRAGQVEHASTYPWSSAPAHVNEETNPVLSEPSWFRSMLSDVRYSDYLDDHLQIAEILHIRQMTYRGLPLGSADFVKRIEKVTGTKVIPSSEGRPRKESKK
jgi:putative transposase